MTTEATATAHRRVAAGAAPVTAVLVGTIALHTAVPPFATDTPRAEAHAQKRRETGRSS